MKLKTIWAEDRAQVIRTLAWHARRPTWISSLSDTTQNWAWECMPIIQTLGKKGHQKVRVTLSYLVSLRLALAT